MSSSTSTCAICGRAIVPAQQGVCLGHAKLLTVRRLMQHREPGQQHYTDFTGFLDSHAMLQTTRAGRRYGYLMADWRDWFDDLMMQALIEALFDWQTPPIEPDYDGGGNESNESNGEVA